MPNLNTAKFTAEDDLPNLEQHNNHMAHVLTLDIYNNLRSKITTSGFTLDHCIQTGIDNPGDYFEDRKNLI
jgi:creatine kinase